MSDTTRTLWDIERSAMAELREYIVEEGYTRESDINDRISEIADGSTPIYNYDRAICLSNNLNLGAYTVDALCLSGDADVWTILGATIYRHIEEHLQANIDELVEERQMKYCAGCDKLNEDCTCDPEDRDDYIQPDWPMREATLIKGKVIDSGALVVGPLLEIDAEEQRYRVSVNEVLRAGSSPHSEDDAVWVHHTGATYVRRYDNGELLAGRVMYTGKPEEIWVKGIVTDFDPCDDSYQLRLDSPNLEIFGRHVWVNGTLDYDGRLDSEQCADCEGRGQREYEICEDPACVECVYNEGKMITCPTCNGTGLEFEPAGPEWECGNCGADNEGSRCRDCGNARHS